MIELSDELDIYEVVVAATIGVHRTIRVEARGESHAREVAKQKVQSDEATHEWTFPPTGQTIAVDPDHITGLLTGMCPKKIEADAYDTNKKALFIGDNIHYRRAGQTRTATINDVFDGQQMLWCDESLFSIAAEEVWKA